MRFTRSALVLAIVLSVSTGCVATRGGLPSSEDYPPPDSARAVDGGAMPSVDYRTHFVGRLSGGSDVFAARVARVLARHPVLAAATPDADSAPLHLDFTLTNTTNRLVAGLTGLACGLSFALVPGYARDDFELVVEVRAGGVVQQRLAYRDSVTTVVHVSAVFTPRESQPRHVVESVVDDMLMHALRDLDARGFSERSVPHSGEAMVPRAQ